jgi:hypothetical protein
MGFAAGTVFSPIEHSDITGTKDSTLQGFGKIGLPGAMLLSADIDWRELGIIEWRIR